MLKLSTRGTARFENPASTRLACSVVVCIAPDRQVCSIGCTSASHPGRNIQLWNDQYVCPGFDGLVWKCVDRLRERRSIAIDSERNPYQHSEKRFRPVLKKMFHACHISATLRWSGPLSCRSSRDRLHGKKLHRRGRRVRGENQALMICFRI